MSQGTKNGSNAAEHQAKVLEVFETAPGETFSEDQVMQRLRRTLTRAQVRVAMYFLRSSGKLAVLVPGSNQWQPSKWGLKKQNGVGTPGQTPDDVS